jgi:amino acid transporter
LIHVVGVAAKTKAGPGIILSYAFAGFASIFSALCYSEFAARVPTSGSAYTFEFEDFSDRLDILMS